MSDPQSAVDMYAQAFAESSSSKKTTTKNTKQQQQNYGVCKMSADVHLEAFDSSTGSVITLLFWPCSTEDFIFLIQSIFPFRGR